MNSKGIRGPQKVRLIITADDERRADREVNLPEDIFVELQKNPHCKTTVASLAMLTFVGGAALGIEDVIDENPGCKITVTIADPGLDLAHILAPYLLCSKQTVADSERPMLVLEDAGLPPEPGEVTVVAAPVAIVPTRRAGRPKSDGATNRKKDRTRLAEAAMKNCPENCLARDVHRVLLAMMDRGDDSVLLPSDLAIIQEETNIKGMTPRVLKLNAGKLVTALVAHDANLTTTKLVTEEAKITKDLTTWFDKNFRGREASKAHPRLPKHAIGVLIVALRALGHEKYRAT